ncbi:MAG: cyclic nucleotide-binding domain-containing protein [Pseudomonadota bacterium]
MAKIRTLRQCSLCHAMSFRDLAILAPFVREESIKAREWLAREGKPTNGLIVLKTGRVRIGLTERAGSELEIGPGEYLGELSLVRADAPRGVGALALEDCEYLRLGTADFRELMTQAPSVAGRLAQGVLEALTEKMGLARDLIAKSHLEKSPD